MSDSGVQEGKAAAVADAPPPVAETAAAETAAPAAQEAISVAKLMRFWNPEFLDGQLMHASSMDKMPACKIEFEDLTYTVPAPTGEGGPPCCPKTREFSILKGMTGALEPGSMTLIISPPGSAGVSTFLRALSGRIDPQRMSGSITYNGKPPSDPTINVQRLVGFVGEDDVHFATLTVRETLTLAHRLLNASSELLASPNAEAFIAAQVQRTLEELHMTGCADTIVGNELLRGVSGGERKRTTFSEMYMGPSRVWLLDKITTGLDSATTVDICRFMRILAKAWRSTIVSSMLAAPPEAYQTYTHILLIRDGQIMYHGRRDGVEAFVNSLGLTVPADEDTADFLQSLVSSPMELYLKQKTAALLAKNQEDTVQQVPQDGLATPAAVALEAEGAASPSMDGASGSVAWKAASSFKYLSKSDLPFLPAAALAAPGPSPNDVPVALLSSVGAGAGTLLVDDAATTVSEASDLLTTALADARTYGGEATAEWTDATLGNATTPTQVLALLGPAYLAVGQGRSPDAALGAAAQEATGSAEEGAVVQARAALVNQAFYTILDLKADVFTTAGMSSHFAKYKQLRDALVVAQQALYTATGGDAANPSIVTSSPDLAALTITEATDILDGDLRPNGVVKPWNAEQVDQLTSAATAPPSGAVVVAVADSSPDKASQAQKATGTAALDATRLRRQASDTHALETNFTQTQFGEGYTVSLWEQYTTLVGRQWLLTIRDTVALRARMIQSIVMALVVGTVYLDTDNTNFQVLFGVMFFAAAMIAFVQISAVEPTNYARKIVLKQRDAHMYNPVLHLVADLTIAIPVSAVDAFLFSIIAYFLVGLVNEAERFLVFFFVALVASVTMGSLFRMVATAVPDLQAAQAAAGPLTGISSVLAGFLISPENMPDWLSWAIYLSPFNWILRALCINEFSSSEYDDPISPTDSRRRGDVYLETFDLETGEEWIWYSVLVLVGMFLALNTCTAFALLYSSGVNAGGRSAHLEDTEAASMAAAEAMMEERQDVLDRELAHRVARMKRAAAASHSPAAVTPADAPMFAQSSTIGMEVLTEKVFEPPIDFPPMTIAWSNLGYTVTLPSGEDKQLLHGIQGFAKPFSMVCLMGASGAGKTTLLDVLAQRKNSGVVQGAITVNGSPVEEVNLPAVTAYCEQMDQHMPWATVRECIAVSARLRLPHTVTDAKVEAFVDNILAVLGLQESADLYVGEAGDPAALPAGARKLLTIGVELASNPSILFLDEPTSGLDAQSAAMVVRVLRRIASQGRSIVCTIHQPAASLFYDFDALLLLKRAGQQIYFGPMGQRAATFTSFLKSAPGTDPLPPRTNVADWMLRVLQQSASPAGTALLEATQEAEASVMQHNTGASLEQKLQDHGLVCAQWFKASALWAASDAECRALVAPDAPSRFSVPAPLNSSTSGGFQASFPTQLSQVMWRQVLSTWRNPKYMWLRLRILTMLGLVFGAVFSDVEGGTLAGANSLAAVMWIGALFVGIVGMMTAFATLAQERPAFYRETAVSMYHPSIYAAAQLLMEVPIVAAGVALFMALFYNLIDFNNKGSELAGYFYIACCMAGLFFVSVGQTLMSVAPTAQVAQIIAGATTSLFMLFSGFLAPSPVLPDYWSWILYINPMFYITEGLISIATHCPDDSDCLTLTTFTSSGPQTVTLEQFTSDFYEFDYGDRWTNMAIVAGFVVAIVAIKMTVQSLFKFETR